MKRGKESLMSSGHEQTLIDEDFMTAVGIEILKRREEKGISRQELSEIVDVNYSYLAQVERGHRTPSFIMFLKLLLALDVRPDSVLWKVLKLDRKKTPSALPFNQAFFELDAGELDTVVATVNVLSEQLLKKREKSN